VRVIGALAISKQPAIVGWLFLASHRVSVLQDVSIELAIFFTGTMAAGGLRAPLTGNQLDSCS
jgi:hypothetical protein